MSGVLDRILAAKREEVAVLRAAGAPARRPSARRPEAVVARLRRPAGAPLRLFTEIKRRSPSAGPLSAALGIEERAVAYASGGATMISVLCDAPFFDGAWEHLARARRAIDEAGLGALLLAKEFVLDETQLACAAESGADMVLLIARIVAPSRLAELVVDARARGLEPLVEVVSDDELGAAVDAGAAVVGVNARDLDTLVMDAPRAARLLAAVPGALVPVHLSGLRTAEDVAALARGPAHAALVGEALMRLDDPSPLLRAMVLAAQPTT